MVKMRYGLQYDFMDRNGLYILFSREPQLTMEDLAPLSVRMMQSNHIPHILSIEVEEINFWVKLRYNLNRKMMFSQYLRSQHLTEQQALAYLLQIVTIVEQSGNYMLNEQHYIVHEDFMFVSEDEQEIYLVYLPLKQLEQKGSFIEEFAMLIQQWSGKIRDHSTHRFESLMQYARSNGCTVAGLKQKIKSLLNESAVVSEIKVQKRWSAAEQGFSNFDTDTYRPQPIREPKPAEPMQKSSIPEVPPLLSRDSLGDLQPNLQPQFIYPPIQERSEPEPSAAQVNEGLSKRNKMIIYMIGVILLAVIWDRYMSAPSESMMYICLGLSLLLIDVVYILHWWRPKGRRQLSGTNLQNERIVQTNVAGIGAGYGGSFGSGNILPAHQTESRLEVEDPLFSHESIDANQYYATLHERTTLLTESKHDATVLLTSSGMMMPKPYLQVNRSGKTECIEITGTSFVIGRMPEANHIENTIGVSRMHFEITEEHGQYAVKDMNSKNGSFFNGEQMIPYKSYPLKEGDVITMVKLEYTFCFK